MEDPYTEFITRVGNMGFTGQLAPALPKMNDQNLLEILDFLCEKYDPDTWKGSSKSRPQIYRVLNQMGLSYLVKDSKQVSMENKKILLALSGVVGKLIDKYGESELYAKHPKKGTMRPQANKENAPPSSPAHNMKAVDEDRGQKRQQDFNNLASAEEVFAKKAKLVRTPIATHENPFASRANVMRTPMQPDEPNLEATRDDVFARKANVMRTPVEPNSEAAREDVFARKANVMRTPVHPDEPNLEATRDDVFARKANVMRTPVQPAETVQEGNRDEIFAKKAEVMRTPVQPHDANGTADGNAFAKNSKMLRTPMDANAVSDSAVGDVFAKKSKLARTPVSHDPPAQQAVGETVDRANTTTITNTRSTTENESEIFGKKAKLQRTPAQPAAQTERDEAFGKKSKLLRTPAQAQEEREEIFQKKAKVARTPVQAASNPPTSTSTAPIAPPLPSDNLESSDVFSVKAKIQRSPIPDTSSLPAASIPTEPTSNSAPSTKDSTYTNVFGAKSKLARTPNLPAAPAPQSEPTREEEDITIMKFNNNTTNPSQRTTPKKRRVPSPQPFLTTKTSTPKKTTQQNKPVTPSKPVTPLKPITPNQKPKPVQHSPIQTVRQHPITPTRPMTLHSQTRTPPKPSEPLRPTPRRALLLMSNDNPFNDVTNYANMLAKPAPVLRTPVSEKTASLITPMKNGQLLDKRTPMASATKHAGVQTPPSSKRKGKSKTPTKMQDPTISNPSLLRPDPFDYAEEADVIEHVDIQPISFNIDPPIEKPAEKPIIFEPPIEKLAVKPIIFEPPTEKPAVKPVVFEPPSEKPTTKPINFEPPIEKQTQPALPNVELGEAETEYLREREEMQRVTTLKAELDQLNKEIAKATKNQEMIQFQIEQLDADIAKEHKIRQSASASLQKAGQQSQPLPLVSTLASELANVKAQQQRQEAKLKASRLSKRDQSQADQVVSAQIQQVTRDIASCIEQRTALQDQMNTERQHDSETIADLDNQIDYQERQYYSVARELEEARQEADHLKVLVEKARSRPPPTVISLTDSERVKQAERTKARMENLLLRTQLLEVARSSVRNVQMMRRQIVS